MPIQFFRGFGSFVAVGVVLLLVAASGCRRTVPDLPAALDVTNVTTGWFDAGLVDGKNKLVPAISFRLENHGDQAISYVQVNAVFRRVGEEEEWSSSLVSAIDRDGLAPGQSTPPIVIRSNLGYTGEQPRMEMLQHREFVDANVELFGKQASEQWVRLATFPIERQLLTR